MPYTPARFDKGMTNRPKPHIMNMLGQADPSKYHTLMEDFYYYNAANWTKTSTGAGTAAQVSGDGGQVALVNSAANADINQIQKIGESFLFEAGKQFWLRVRGMVDDATNANWFAGLQVTNVDGSATGTVTDGLFFLKPAATTNVSVHFRKNTAAGAESAVVTQMANATMITLDAYYDGVATLFYGFNGTTLVGRLDASASFLPDTTLSPIVGVKNGTAAARTGTFDYLLAIKER